MKSWEIQVAFILKNVDNFTAMNNKLSKFINNIASHLLKIHNDIWAYSLLKLVIGESPFKDLNKENLSVINDDYELNIIYSIIELLGPRCE